MFFVNASFSQVCQEGHRSYEFCDHGVRGLQIKNNIAINLSILNARLAFHAKVQQGLRIGDEDQAMPF